MNTNDELRAMLNEREVNWDYGITGAATTKFRANGVDLTFMPMRDGLICTTILNPAQIIAATLGESMTDTEKAALERRIDELCAEVGRGKAEFKKMDVWHSQELKAAMDENAKLRELVDELYPLADYGAMDASELDRAHDLMRELGIEVPE